MFCGNSRKILAIACFGWIFFSACRLWQKSETNVSNQNPAIINEISGDVPFSNKEPENYQAEITTQIYADGEKSERKILTARNGTRRITIFDFGEKAEISLLNLGDSSYSIDKEKKVYAENKPATNISGNAGDDFLTTEWLNAKTSADFENLGTENNLTKFRTRISESANSEILTYVDETMKVPVKQEFYKIDGEQKTLTFSVEVKNFKSPADEKLFDLPKDYRQISPNEFQEMIRREK